MPDQHATAYDRISYPGHPFGETHPGHLATLATLFGMDPAPLDSCRVLELGCGDGANLIPVAFQWPQSEFVGLDLSEQAVRRGNALIARLGLKNIVLRVCDIMDVSAASGTFDYIIAHGVYSWVPDAVRGKMLSILRENLTAQGIGYVSYNCYPGCHSRDIARAMMRYHVRGVTDPQQRVAQSRALLSLMAEASAEDTIYGFELRNQLDRIKDVDDNVLFHDDLSEVATPFYLHEVAEAAARHGLQYLCDAAFSVSRFEQLPPLARQALAAIPEDDAVTREQYADFMEARAFRASLFCHDNIRLNRSIDPRCVTRCHLGTSALPLDEAFDPAASGAATFKTENGSTLTTDHRLSKAVIQDARPDLAADHRLLRCGGRGTRLARRRSRTDQGQPERGDRCACRIGAPRILGRAIRAASVSAPPDHDGRAAAGGKRARAPTGRYRPRGHQPAASQRGDEG